MPADKLLEPAGAAMRTQADLQRERAAAHVAFAQIDDRPGEVRGDGPPRPSGVPQGAGDGWVGVTGAIDHSLLFENDVDFRPRPGGILRLLAATVARGRLRGHGLQLLLDGGLVQSA